MDSKPAISALKKLDKGITLPRSEIQAWIKKKLYRRAGRDTCAAWVRGRKGIRGKEDADRLSKEASIYGHESEGVVIPAGLRAFSKRVRAEARGGVLWLRS